MAKSINHIVIIHCYYWLSHETIVSLKGMMLAVESINALPRRRARRNKNVGKGVELANVAILLKRRERTAMSLLFYY